MRLINERKVLYKFSGGFVERVTPVPIPNTEVKPLRADGTAREAVWESRTPPGLFLRESPLKDSSPERASFVCAKGIKVILLKSNFAVRTCNLS